MISRRTVLQGVLGTTLALQTGRASAQQAQTWVVRIDLDRADLPVADMVATLRAFTDRRVPVLAVLGPEPGAAAVGAITDLASAQGGFLECGAVLTGDPGNRRYFQTRAASDLRRSLAERGWLSRLPLRCCVLPPDAGAVDAYAFRDAGFNILLQDGAQAPDVTFGDGGLLQIRGNLPVQAADDPETVLARGGPPVGVIRFSIADLIAGARQDVWAGALSDAFWQGRAFVALPSDILLQNGRGITSRLALVLEAPDDDPAAVPVQDILAQVAQRGWSLSLAQPGFADGGAAALRNCDPQAAGADPAGGIDCGAAGGAGERVALLPPDSAAGWTGLRADGVFQLQTAVWPDGGLVDALRLDPFSDRVLVLRPDDIRTPIQRRRIMADLDAYAAQGRSGVTSVDRLVTDLLAPPVELDRLWSHRARMALDPPGPRPLDGSARASLLDDARIAWNFIAQNADARTGFCVGTIDLGPRGRSDKSITMWDVASQMLGTLGAGSLGLIDRAEVTGRLDLVLSNLPVTRLGGHRLPPSFFHASDLTALQQGFDSCDTGRFLIALSAAVGSGAITRQRAEECLGRWDLSAAIRGGRLHNFTAGRFVDVTQSHCNPYVARGYAQWGFHIARALPRLPDAPNADDLMALLFAAGEIGAFGTEPLLLDMLETGADPAIRYLAEILFDAQLSWFEQTGTYKCVSESPLNFAPWFVYSGLRVDLAGEEGWTIQTLVDSPDVRTPAFRRKAEVLSTKSAYLWEALFPHPYSTALRDLMQQRARIGDRGFSAGLFAPDLSPMENYADLNTNGIILSAIARMLG